MKKQIETRIRGWIPKETTLPKTSTQTYFSPTQIFHLNDKPTLTEIGPDAVRVTRFLGFIAGLWAISSFLFITEVYRYYPISISSLILCVTVGSIVGLIMSALFTQSQIRYFEINNSFPTPNAGALFVTTVVAVFVIMIAGYGLAFTFPAIATEILISVFSLSPAFYAARSILFSRYEKKKEIYIIQYWLQLGTFALPKKVPGDDRQVV